MNITIQTTPHADELEALTGNKSGRRVYSTTLPEHEHVTIDCVNVRTTVSIDGANKHPPLPDRVMRMIEAHDPRWLMGSQAGGLDADGFALLPTNRLPSTLAEGCEYAALRGFVITGRLQGENEHAMRKVILDRFPSLAEEVIDGREVRGILAGVFA